MHEPETGPIASPLVQFLNALSTDGRVTVQPFSPEPIVMDQSGEEILRGWDASTRLQLSSEAPALDLQAATWACVLFYRACQFLVCREVSAAVVRETLRAPAPSPIGPSTIYSVDLAFRFLPQLFSLATRLAPQDELVGALKIWSHAWPLSSVGVPLTENFSIAVFAQWPSLLRLYVDRLSLHRATDRMRDPEVRALLRADLGLFPELEPVLARHLETDSTS